MIDFIEDTSKKELFYKKENDMHLEKFGVEPNIIGMFWADANLLVDNILQAIEDNKSYNEYDLLSKEEQKAFDDGNLLF